MTSKKIVFIVNPKAGNGLTGRNWPLIQAMAHDRLGSFTACVTKKPGDAIRITRKNLMEGAEVIVCVGGDGTLNEVINGFTFEEQSTGTGAVLGFVPHGTGCDFVRTAPIPAKIEQALDTIKEGHVSAIDLGRLQYHDHEDCPRTRYFHNITSFGLGGEVDDRVNRGSKVFGPLISFIRSTLVSLFLYGKKSIRLKVDNLFDEEVITWNVAVANGQYHGGGMRIAPDAAIDDGLFHITVVGNLSLVEVIWHFPKLYDGRIKNIGNVSFLTGKKVEASSEQQVLLDVDGEQPGHLPVVIDILPSALHMLTRKT